MPILSYSMPIFEKNFNDELFWKLLWRKIYNVILKDGIIVSKLSEKIGKPQSYVSNLLNWKRVTKNIEPYREIALAAWITDLDFKKFVISARKEEYTQSTGDNFQTPEISIDTLEGLDLNNMDLIRVVMKREMWKDPTDSDIATILSVIKMKKNS